jgi:hypothetical protein
MDQMRRLLDDMVLSTRSRFDETTIDGPERRTYYVVEGLDGAEPVHSTEPLHSVEAPMERPQGAIA